jgi:hypothetical protein
MLRREEATRKFFAVNAEMTVEDANRTSGEELRTGEKK